MIRYAIADPEGYFIGIFRSDAGAAAPAVDQGNTAVLIPSPEFDGTNDADFMAAHMYSAQTGQVVAFVPTLPMAQRAAKQAAAVHFAALFALPNGFTVSGVLYQIDAASQVAISGLAQAAAADIANPGSVPLPAFWIAADNSRQALTAAQYYAMAAAIGNYVSGCRLHFRAIKDAILAAPTVVAVQAIDVTAGYPSASA